MARTTEDKQVLVVNEQQYGTGDEAATGGAVTMTSGAGAAGGAAGAGAGAGASASLGAGAAAASTGGELAAGAGDVIGEVPTARWTPPAPIPGAAPEVLQRARHGGFLQACCHRWKLKGGLDVWCRERRTAKNLC